MNDSVTLLLTFFLDQGDARIQVDIKGIVDLGDGNVATVVSDVRTKSPYTDGQGFAFEVAYRTW
ncbi:MAG: hypothetical protein BWY72_02174 [Bacteroidetes bacterium ADurb.Bin416]|nr:MAG: hypothetical protein BWY72_02174 [Bacteroidetes bacterium ADurb.Bin416]